jgi:hypothetical protein
MIDRAGLEGRVRRLEVLSRGLAKEVGLWKAGDDPLLYLERRAYLNAIQDALAGLEGARVVLAKALTRNASGMQNAECRVQNEKAAEAGTSSF